MVFFNAPGGGSVIEPVITGLNLDLKRGVGITRQFDGSDTITEWQSQDANNNIAYELLKGRQPRYVNGYAQFDGDTVSSDADILTVDHDAANFAFNDNFSFFMVARQTPGSIWSGFNTIMQKGSNGVANRFFINQGFGQAYFNLAGDQTAFGSGSGLETDAWKVYIVTAESGGTVKTYWREQGNATINTNTGSWTYGSNPIGDTANLILAGRFDGGDNSPIEIAEVKMKAGIFTDLEIGLLLQYGLALGEVL
ncbi:MAG: hypothetical protein KTR14_02000 [Vampirovibrio sp.]|nr:hypothetical protein [Vampirovibrio sp.]